ncbi:hypothetical protein BpHYR1_029414, partial [Brachionus plicatilis]
NSNKKYQLFQSSRLIDVQPDTNHFTKNDDLFNISFNMQDFNEILTENNDLKNFLEKIKSKFEMLLSECKEIETKLYISGKENEELKSKLENVQEKEKDSTNRFVKFCEKEHYQIEARLEQSLNENKNLIDTITNLDRRSNLIKKENVELKDEIVKLDEENKLLNDKIKEKKCCHFPNCDDNENKDLKKRKHFVLSLCQLLQNSTKIEQFDNYLEIIRKEMIIMNLNKNVFEENMSPN